MKPKNGFDDHYEFVQRHDEDEGEIYYEIVNYGLDLRIYVHGAATAATINQICKKLNK